MLDTLSPRQRAFFLIALCQRPKEAGSLFSLISGPDGEVMTKMHDELKSSREDDLQRVARSELRKLAQSKNRTYLHDIHDDWLADILAQESPLMIATILRNMPADRAHHILERLPEEILAALPKMSETFAIPSALAAHLKTTFEGQFEVRDVLPKGKALGFQAFFLLRASQIAKVFLETGYREIALGLFGVPAEVRNLVLSRLLPPDRERVEHYLLHAQAVGEQRAKRAQTHLVSKQADPNNPQGFVRELGWLIFAKSLLAADLDEMDLVCKKMSKLEAKALKEAIDEQLTKNTEMTVRVYREDILDAMRSVLGA